jgi:hypothetical protein
LPPPPNLRRHVAGGVSVDSIMIYSRDNDRC